MYLLPKKNEKRKKHYPNPSMFILGFDGTGVHYLKPKGQKIGYSPVPKKKKPYTHLRLSISSSPSPPPPSPKLQHCRSPRLRAQLFDITDLHRALHPFTRNRLNRSLPHNLHLQRLVPRRSQRQLPAKQRIQRRRDGRDARQRNCDGAGRIVQEARAEEDGPEPLSVYRERFDAGLGFALGADVALWQGNHAASGRDVEEGLYRVGRGEGFFGEGYCCDA